MKHERCDFCKEEDVDVELSSGYLICSRCFSEIAQKSHNAKDLNTLTNE